MASEKVSVKITIKLVYSGHRWPVVYLALLLVLPLTITFTEDNCTDTLDGQSWNTLYLFVMNFRKYPFPLPACSFHLEVDRRREV